MEIKSVIVGSCIGAIVNLLFFMEMTIVMGIDNSTDNNCIDIDCLIEQIKRMCMDGRAPSYLDCENILRCIDAGEQEIMKCAKVYLLSVCDLYNNNSSFDDMLLHSWCEYVLNKKSLSGGSSVEDVQWFRFTTTNFFNVTWPKSQ